MNKFVFYLPNGLNHHFNNELLRVKEKWVLMHYLDSEFLKINKNNNLVLISLTFVLILLKFSKMITRAKRVVLS